MGKHVPCCVAGTKLNRIAVAAGATAGVGRVGTGVGGFFCQVRLETMQLFKKILCFKLVCEM